MWYEVWNSKTGNRVGRYDTWNDAMKALTEDFRLDNGLSPEIQSLTLVGCGVAKARVWDGEKLEDAILTW